MKHGKNMLEGSERSTEIYRFKGQGTNGMRVKCTDLNVLCHTMWRLENRSEYFNFLRERKTEAMGPPSGWVTHLRTT